MLNKEYESSLVIFSSPKPFHMVSIKSIIVYLLHSPASHIYLLILCLCTKHIIINVIKSNITECGAKSMSQGLDTFAANVLISGSAVHEGQTYRPLKESH